MSSNTHKIFAALGDETRLHLVSRLCAEGPLSTTKLSQRSKFTRQAITKHLHVMEKARLLRCRRAGRETLWSLDNRRLNEARESLDAIAQQWDSALIRLKKFVED